MKIKLKQQMQFQMKNNTVRDLHVASPIIPIQKHNPNNKNILNIIQNIK